MFVISTLPYKLIPEYYAAHIWVFHTFSCYRSGYVSLGKYLCANKMAFIKNGIYGNVLVEKSHHQQFSHGIHRPWTISANTQ